jgi:hypothetical protein
VQLFSMAQGSVEITPVKGNKDLTDSKFWREILTLKRGQQPLINLGEYPVGVCLRPGLEVWTLPCFSFIDVFSFQWPDPLRNAFFLAGRPS